MPAENESGQSDPSSLSILLMFVVWNLIEHVRQDVTGISDPLRKASGPGLFDHRPLVSFSRRKKDMHPCTNDDNDDSRHAPIAGRF